MRIERKERQIPCGKKLTKACKNKIKNDEEEKEKRTKHKVKILRGDWIIGCVNSTHAHVKRQM